MTGALHAAVPLSPGGVFTAEFDRLGTVTIRVSAAHPPAPELTRQINSVRAAAAAAVRGGRLCR